MEGCRQTHPRHSALLPLWTSSRQPVCLLDIQLHQVASFSHSNTHTYTHTHKHTHTLARTHERTNTIIKNQKNLSVQSCVVPFVITDGESDLNHASASWLEGLLFLWPCGRQTRLILPRSWDAHVYVWPHHWVGICEPPPLSFVLFTLSFSFS